MTEKKPDPTEEEITDECEKIRRKWTAIQKKQRQVQKVEPWQLPEYNARELFEAEEGEQ